MRRILFYFECESFSARLRSQEEDSFSSSTLLSFIHRVNYGVRLSSCSYCHFPLLAVHIFRFTHRLLSLCRRRRCRSIFGLLIDKCLQRASSTTSFSLISSGFSRWRPPTCVSPFYPPYPSSWWWLDDRGVRSSCTDKPTQLTHTHL